MTAINGYEVKTEWILVPTGSWALAKKNGKIYFFKRLSFPKYPDNPETYPPEAEATIKMKACCEKFEKAFKDKAAAIKAANEKCGTLVPPLDLLRTKQTYYYASEAVEGDHLAPEDVCTLPQADRYAIMKDLAEALAALESAGIVHGNITPSNVILVKKDGRFRPMLVGFDGCFYSGRPLAPEHILATPAYDSPEMATYLSEKDPAIGSKISYATDVYSAALLFYLYQTGKQLVPKKETAYDYPYQAPFDDLDVSAASDNKKFLCMLEKMLAPKAGDRVASKDIPAMIDKL